MAVTEVLEAVGSFEVQLAADTPREVLDAVDHFGHIAIVPGRVSPQAVGDGLLAAARYVGVVRARAVDDDRRTKRVEDQTRISGVGMAWWLGDEDDKGSVFETAVQLNQVTFPNAVRALLPASGAVTEGTLYGLDSYTGATATSVNTSPSTSYLVASDADAVDIAIGAKAQLFTAGGVLKESTVFTVTAKPSAFGFTNVTFSPAAQAAPTSEDQLRVGTFATYSGRHQWETPLKALTYLCDTMSSASSPVGWRVNGDGTLDAGPVSSLYVTDPTCVIVKSGAGEDMRMRALPGSTGVTRDMEDYSTRVVLLAEGEGESIVTASADISPATPYKDIHGNPVRLTRMVSESDTTVENASQRASIALAQYTSSRDALELSTNDYDVHGSFRTGDYVWVYDPDQGLVDTANEVTFRGERINPMRLRAAETVWPVVEGYSVAYRAGDGTWWDLTDYIVWESAADVRITVGDFQRALTTAGTEPVGSRPNYDTSTPDIPTLIEPFMGSAYLDGRGFTRARVILAWSAPNNVDGSTILDGDHYEIRWAIDTDMIYPATWAQVAQVRWMDLQTWAQPFAAPDDDWSTMFVAWGETTAQLQDLSPGVGYDVQIRAVDKAGNRGAWSAVTTFVASSDNIPPSTPAAPVVAASRIAVQVTHTLGKASGGTYNLERDLHHLEIHVSYEPGFTPDETTLKTKVSATAGMIQGQVPVVVTVQVEETSERYVRVVAVDQTGNKSGPSDAASATVLLIDDAHISDLTVSKVTAGTISATWLLAGEIKTADSGARARMSMDGFELYNAAGTRTFIAESATGNVEIIGELSSGTSGQRIVVNPEGAGVPEIRFYPTTGTDYAMIRAVDSGEVPASDPSIMVRSGLGASTDYGVTALTGDRTFIGRYVLEPGNAYWPQGGNLFMTKDYARISYYDRAGTDTFGGAFYADATQANLGFLSGIGTEDASMNFSGVDGSIRAIGEIESSTDAQSAWIVGNMSVTGGPYTTVTRTYGPTYSGTPRFIPYVSDGDATGSTIVPHMTTANSSTGFTVRFSASTTAGFTMWYWGWRSN